MVTYCVKIASKPCDVLFKYHVLCLDLGCCAFPVVMMHIPMRDGSCDVTASFLHLGMYTDRHTAYQLKGRLKSSGQMLEGYQLSKYASFASLTECVHGYLKVFYC